VINGQAKSDGTISFLNHGVAWHHSNLKVADTNWHHIVVTIDGSGNAIVYYDASASTTLTGATTRDPQDGSAIGAQTITVRNFDGAIDEVGIWDKVLSQADVTAIYNSGSGIPYDAGGAASVDTSTSLSLMGVGM